MTGLGELERQGRELEQWRRYRRLLLLRWAAWSLVPWIALVRAGAPYESFGEAARAAFMQSWIAPIGGAILLAAAALLTGTYRRLRYGISF